MAAWVELFRDNPVSCICLVMAAGGAGAAILAAIRGEGRK